MRIILTKNYEESCEKVAQILLSTVDMHKDACLGLATGGSMEGVYVEVLNMLSQRNLSFKNVKTVNLDEYVGIPPEHPQSYRHYMNVHLFDHIDIDKKNTYVPSGVCSPEETLAEFKKYLFDHPRKLQLLGVGSNGHIGFNEPDSSLDAEAHITNLNDQTRKDNARYFSSIDEVPHQAFTMGIGDIIKASKIALLIHGRNKIKAVQELLGHTRISTQCPCTVLKLHPNVDVVLTEELYRSAGF